MRRKAGTICMALGTLLLMAALCLLAYNRWDNWRAGQTVADIQDTLEAVEEERGSSLTVDDIGDIPENEEMATIEIDGYAYIGTLSIPGFGLELPVMAEWSYAGLKIAPGRYSGSAWTDDLIICGHNYDRHFGNLKYLEAGDAVTFTDVEGNAFSYQVEQVITLQPMDVEKMLSQTDRDWDLTLFTCTLGGQTRVTVRCSRIEETESAESSANHF